MFGLICQLWAFPFGPHKWVGLAIWLLGGSEQTSQSLQTQSQLGMVIGWSRAGFDIIQLGYDILGCLRFRSVQGLGLPCPVEK